MGSSLKGVLWRARNHDFSPLHYSEEDNMHFEVDWLDPANKEYNWTG
jgi:hypothetical protein